MLFCDLLHYSKDEFECDMDEAPTISLPAEHLVSIPALGAYISLYMPSRVSGPELLGNTSCCIPRTFGMRHGYPHSGRRMQMDHIWFPYSHTLHPLMNLRSGPGSSGADPVVSVQFREKLVPAWLNSI